jgi:hypothetical protein
MAKSKQCKVPTKQGQKLDHATKHRDIAAEIEVSQRWALRQHSRKPLYLIEAEIEVSQRCALPHRFYPIVDKIEVSQRCALPQHSCKALCPRIAPLVSSVYAQASCPWSDHDTRY